MRLEMQAGEAIGRDHRVEEVQGWAGPVHVSELLVQKLWLRQDLDPRGLRTTDGTAVEIHFPGEWNRLAGPDFRGAEISLGGQRRVGDLELHFHAGDWFAHRHHTDPAFNGVILHLLVFPPGRAEAAAHRQDGGDVPQVVLAPHLNEDLEAYALADAMGALGAQDLLDRAAPWLELPLAERRAAVQAQAWQRWQRKVAGARRRLAEADWGEAVHRWTLEVLGYRRNRVAMLTVATAFPSAVWRKVPPPLPVALAAAEGQWKRQGLRPANFPEKRLAQYEALWAIAPDWPAQLAQWARQAPSVGEVGESTRAFRRRAGQTRAGNAFHPEALLTAAGIGGSRAQTILLDAWWPLAAALADAEEAWFPAWYHAAAGDLPDAVKDLARMLRLAGTGTPRALFCHGLGQGLLPLLLEPPNPASRQ